MSLNYDIRSIPDTTCWLTLPEPLIVRGLHGGKYDTLEAFLADNDAYGWTDPAMDPSSVTYDPALPRSVTRMSVTTECLIFATMSVMMGCIDKSNWREFYTRLHMYERVSGGLRIDHGPKTSGHIFFTPAEVKAHIGLSCNVKTESKAVFKNHLSNILRSQAERALREAERIEAEALLAVLKDREANPSAK